MPVMEEGSDVREPLPSSIEPGCRRPGRGSRPARRPTAGPGAALVLDVMRHRGQFCYVSAVLPGHREPTPIPASALPAISRPLGHRV